MNATVGAYARELKWTIVAGLGGRPSQAEQPTAGQCCKACTQCGQCSGANHCYCFCNCSGVGTSYCWTGTSGCIASGCIPCAC